MNNPKELTPYQIKIYKQWDLAIKQVIKTTEEVNRISKELKDKGL